MEFEFETKSSKVFMDEARYLGDDLRIIDVYGDVTNRPHFWFKLEKIESPYVHGAVESFVGGITLLNYGMLGQSYILLFQALETTLKSFLDHLERFGEAQWWAKHKELMHQAAKRAKARYSSDMMDKAREDLKFFQAFGMVDEKIAFEWEGNIMEANSIRNEIVHLGLKEERRKDCLRHLFQTLIPVLDELYLKVFDIHLADRIYAEAARELAVAGRVARLSDFDSETTRAALQTLGPALRVGASGEPQDEQHVRHWIEENVEYAEGGFQIPCPIACKICKQEAFGFTEGTLYEDGSRQYFELSEFYCPRCELDIRPPYGEEEERNKEQELITAVLRIHYGMITSHTLLPACWSELLKMTGNTNKS